MLDFTYKVHELCEKSGFVKDAIEEKGTNIILSMELNLLLSFAFVLNLTSLVFFNTLRVYLVPFTCST